ncbi:hypothetical protein MCEMSEM47_01024 [Burkholderiales bacterium]|jgi:hypothetical protein
MADIRAPLWLLMISVTLCSAGSSMAATLTWHEERARQDLTAALAELDLEERSIAENARIQRAACLSRWVSSSCLEAVRQQRAREERSLLMARETLAESVRRIDAAARQRVRANRLEELNAR